MEKIEQLLKNTRLLEDISTDIIRDYIVPYGKMNSYEKGSSLIVEDQKVDHIHVLISGKVNMLYYYADGSYSLAGTIVPFGIAALDLVTTKTRISPYHAVAAESSVIFSLPADLMLKPGRMPETQRQMILNQLMLMLAHLHMKKEKHLMILSRNGLRDRIMIYLSLQSQMKKSLEFTIPFSREEMAAYLCVNRSTLSHELSLMKKEGILDFSKNRFTLMNIEQSKYAGAGIEKDTL